MRLVLAAAILLPIALGGCSVELPGSGEAPRLFVLSPKSSFADDLPKVSWQLLIDTPITAAGLSSQRIALNRNRLEMEYFANAGWTDSLPNLVQRLMIESFENSGKIISVGRQAIGLRANFIVNTDLREFQAEYDPATPEAPPKAHVKINAKLIKMPERRIVASRTFEHSIVAKSGKMEDIIKAFDDSLGKALKRIVGWTLRNGDRIDRESTNNS
ncbi:MAG: ABC-type transport auxiliary lipoprotein family protein [Alphaproteobacteria bacterium]